MTRDEALSLLRDFSDNSYHLLPVIHEASTRTVIHDFYTRISNGQQVDPSCAGLILSIAATSAYFWKDGAPSFYSFSTREAAASRSLAWKESAFEILNSSHSNSSLVDVQARAIMLYLVYNTEGLSVRSRCLLGRTLVAARDIGLHLVDSPRSDLVGDASTREIKRRLWWHLASTDWFVTEQLIVYVITNGTCQDDGIYGFTTGRNLHGSSAIYDCEVPPEFERQRS